MVEVLLNDRVSIAYSDICDERGGVVLKTRLN